MNSWKIEWFCCIIVRCPNLIQCKRNAVKTLATEWKRTFLLFSSVNVMRSGKVHSNICLFAPISFEIREAQFDLLKKNLILIPFFSLASEFCKHHNICYTICIQQCTVGSHQSENVNIHSERERATETQRTKHCNEQNTLSTETERCEKKGDTWKMKL